MTTLRTVPCFTCGAMPTGIFSDGSPRYDHGHDLATGARWTSPTRGHDALYVRRCPACGHEHPVGTTCMRCPACGPDRTDATRAASGLDLAEAASAADGDAEPVDPLRRCDAGDRHDDAPIPTNVTHRTVGLGVTSRDDRRGPDAQTHCPPWLARHPG